MPESLNRLLNITFFATFSTNLTSVLYGERIPILHHALRKECYFRIPRHFCSCDLILSMISDANNNRQDARSNYFFNLNGPQQPQQQQGGGGPRLQYVEYKVPALWKRFAAEFIDFLVLFLLKIIVTFVAVDWFSIIDLDRQVLKIDQFKEWKTKA